MNEPQDDIELRLAELGRNTEAIGPRPGFEAKVMFAIQKEPSTFASNLLASSRWVLSFGALATALTVGWAVYAESAVNVALATTFGMAELSW